MKKSWMIGSVLVSAMALAAPAAAAEQDGGEAAGTPQVENRGVITLPEYEIAGRWNRPQAAMAISRISTRLTLVELKQLFLDRIEQTILSGPF
jgi:hypothetical protein